MYVYSPHKKPPLKRNIKAEVLRIPEVMVKTALKSMKKKRDRLMVLEKAGSLIV